MTKKLYLYNNICYDECPFGSIKDNITFTCKEINLYVSTNISLNEYLFRNYNEHYILKYLSESANNVVEIIRAHDFSNYFYNQSTNYSYQLNLTMPILNLTECVVKLKIKYNLDDNNTIFYGIMEYNDIKKKNGINYINLNLVNSTSYQLFLENGTILPYEICENINITTEKKVDTSKIDIELMKKIYDKFNVSLFDTDNELFNDLCLPFSIDDEDLSLYERRMLIKNYKFPCDDNCTFIDFNFDTFYSTCKCPIKSDGKNVLDKVLDVSDLQKIFETKNYEYFRCYKAFSHFPKDINMFFFIIFIP
jgi:hypothetical protein